MLANLREALKDKKISFLGFAGVLGISEKSVQNKIYEITEFTYSEVKKTMTDLFPEYNTDYLFASDGTKPQATE